MGSRVPDLVGAYDPPFKGTTDGRRPMNIVILVLPSSSTSIFFLLAPPTRRQPNHPIHARRCYHSPRLPTLPKPPPRPVHRSRMTILLTPLLRRR
jgi:hypothetical protein